LTETACRNASCTDDAITTQDGTKQKQCIQKALCDNKSLAEQLTDIETNSKGVDVKFKEDNHIYYNALLNTANLGFGILVILGFIYTSVFRKPPPINK